MLHITTDQLCKDKPCTCGAAIHDPITLARIAKIFRNTKPSSGEPASR